MRSNPHVLTVSSQLSDTKHSGHTLKGARQQGFSRYDLVSARIARRNMTSNARNRRGLVRRGHTHDPVDHDHTECPQTTAQVGVGPSPATMTYGKVSIPRAPGTFDVPQFATPQDLRWRWLAGIALATAAMYTARQPSRAPNSPLSGQGTVDCNDSREAGKGLLLALSTSHSARPRPGPAGCVLGHTRDGNIPVVASRQQADLGRQGEGPLPARKSRGGEGASR